MAAYRRVDDLQSPAGSLPVYRDQLWAQRSVSNMVMPLLFTLQYLEDFEIVARGCNNCQRYTTSCDVLRLFCC